MNRTSHCLLISVAVFTCSMAGAQEVPEPSKPTEGHAFLKRFAGEWETRAEGTGGPVDPAMVAEGVTKSRMLGELWVVSDVTIEVSGFRATAVQTIGFDPDRKKYVGTWVDSVHNHLWQYEGWIDDSGQKLILEATGPNPSAPEKMSLFRDAYEFKSDDHIISTSSMQTDDGEWAVFLTGEMRRKSDHARTE